RVEGRARGERARVHGVAREHRVGLEEEDRPRQGEQCVDVLVWVAVTRIARLRKTGGFSYLTRMAASSLMWLGLFLRVRSSRTLTTDSPVLPRVRPGVDPPEARSPMFPSSTAGDATPYDSRCSSSSFFTIDRAWAIT